MTAPLSRGRIAAIVAGGVLALGGLGLAVAGGGLFAVFGSDGKAASGSHSLSTSATALVSSVADLDGVSDVADIVGDTRLGLSVSGERPAGRLFVGVGPAAQVERYLASASIDEVTDFEIDPFKLTRERRPGTARPQPPASQSFWVAQGTGAGAAALRWKLRDGDYRLVLMNSDASPDVRAAGVVDLTVPRLPEIAWGLLAAAVLLLGGGLGAILVAARSPRS